MSALGRHIFVCEPSKFVAREQMLPSHTGSHRRTLHNYDSTIPGDASLVRVLWRQWRHLPWFVVKSAVDRHVGRLPPAAVSATDSPQRPHPTYSVALPIDTPAAREPSINQSINPGFLK